MHIKSFIGFIIGILAMAGVIVFVVLRGESSPPAKIYHIAIITRKDVGTYQEAIQSYRKKMTELGYGDGQNVFYDIYQFNNSSELKQIVSNVISSHPDIIHTYSTPATVQAYQETKHMTHPIPVVFGSMGDPLAAGVIHDIQSPGTNVTGVTSLATELTANRIRFLKEIKPGIKRVAMPHSAESLNDASANKSVDIAKDTAYQLGITLVLFPVATQEDNAIVAKTITKEKIDGMIVGGDSLVWGSIDAYIAQAIKEKIPMAAFDVTQITKGALIGIGPDYTRAGKQAAILTHKILSGSLPAIIPVQIPQKLIFAVNLTTAKAIGITLGDDLLKRADIVIGK